MKIVNNMDSSLHAAELLLRTIQDGQGGATSASAAGLGVWEMADRLTAAQAEPGILWNCVARVPSRISRPLMRRPRA